MATKKGLNKRKSPFGQFPAKDRQIASRTTYPSVVYYHNRKQNFGIPTNTKTPGQKRDIEDDNLQNTERGILEEEIAQMSVSKNIEQPSGSFSLTLFPTQNWKRKLAAGDWVLIYMNEEYGFREKYENGKLNSKNLLMLGNIDRVSRRLEKNEDTDKIELRYVVSGRNFGKVFEKSDIWFDPYANQIETLDVALRSAGLQLQGNPSTICNALLNVFLGDGGEFPTGRTSNLGSWIMPKEILKIMGATGSGNRFIDILDNQIEDDLPGFKTREMLTLDSNGSLHDMLKRSANELVNELYYEEVRDNDGLVKPTLVLKPRPISTPFITSHGGDSAEKQAETSALLNSQLKGKFTTLQDLAKKNFLEITPAEIKYEDLGRDDHSKFNMFWLRTTHNFEHAFSQLSNLNKKFGIANPTISRGSIQRDGLRRYDQTLEYCYVQGTGNTAIKSPSPNIKLFEAFMIQLYDMHFANHLYDAGTITTSGVLEAELGKALNVLPPDVDSKSPIKTKTYFIEGYEHQWTFPKHWETTFTVTHGQFKVDKGINIFIDVAPDDFGQDDQFLQTVYLAKTNAERK